MNMNFDLNERARFNDQLRDVEAAPLAERQEARAEWADALTTTPETIAERIGWLIDGSYGFGAYQLAQDVIRNKRMNRTAWLGLTIAALEWQCPSNFARQAWNKLDKPQQDKITALIMAEIESALTEAEANA